MLQPFVVHVGVGGDFTRQHNQAGVGQGFGGHAAARVLRKNCVQNCVGNLVGHFVGVAFRDRFGGEEEVVRHLKIHSMVTSSAVAGLWSLGERFSWICESPASCSGNSAMRPF